MSKEKKSRGIKCLLEEKLVAGQEPDRYFRYPFQSLMTAAEWRNVEMSVEYAQHLGKKISMFHYPYFSQVLGLWRIFWNSKKVASRQGGGG